MVAIGNTTHIRRGLHALETQAHGVSFDVVVVGNAAVADFASLRQEFRSVTFLTPQRANTPVSLTAEALKAIVSGRVLLTEDSCVADPAWVKTLSATDWRNHGAVGGLVLPSAAARRAMWAFLYVDFFRYMLPAQRGETPTLSVCNVAYHASQLTELRDAWIGGFHETEVHRALAQRFGALWLETGAHVSVERDVTFTDALAERYSFGRIFAATRIAHTSAARRAFYALFAPALPVLLLGRMTVRAGRHAPTLRKFAGALAHILALVLAWSWGELLGYLTGRLPAKVTTAPERL